jgi:uncharacterized protein involved in outer membrane biogenesis
VRFLRSKFWRSKPVVATLCVALLLALFLVRPGANRLRTRIVRSISMALGRQVDVGSVRLRLLPEPGFDLENFVVHDDPAFGAEPMLRSQEVTAVLRVSSLLRGRLEIARLSLIDPSLNLVRSGEGHWNLGNLVERAAKTPVAPTSKPRTEARPGFPYIEADRGRINFKFGPEKKAFALTDADFALWQDSENAWGVRLKAQPVRTDFNLTDTGTIRISGSWQRAATLRQTPLQFSLQWDRAQLGQISKLAYGSDKGWRGTIKLSAALTGTPADLTVATEASVQDFRRYDILGGGALKLAAQCNAHYSSGDHALSNLTCRAPVGDTAITLDGSVSGYSGARTYDLVLIARDLPMQSLVALARHAKKGIPDDLLASGKVDANVKLRRTDGPNGVAWQGGGEIQGVRIGSKLAKAELTLERIPFAVSSGVVSNAKRMHDRNSKVIAQPHFDIGSFNLALGRPTPAVVRGWASRSGYGLLLQGDTQLQRLFQVARMVGLRAPQPAADGVAKVDLQIAGDWLGFRAPQTVGKAQLHSVRAEVRGLNAPLKIDSANLSLAQDEVHVDGLTASLAGTIWHGSLNLPRQCADSGDCPIRFNLQADQIATDELSRLLDPRPAKRPWYRFLSSSALPGVPYLSALHATGRLTADRVVVHKLVATRVSSDVELQTGKLRLWNLTGEVLGGRHSGEWKADFTAKPPEYSGSGALERVALGQLAEAMHDGWISGTATAKYRATASGFSGADLLSSAKGALRVEVRDGLLPHITLAGSTGPLHIHRLLGQLILRDGKFEIQEGKLETAGGIYQIIGTASLNRILDVKLTREGARGFNITGPLTEPIVAPATIPETQASLKP